MPQPRCAVRRDLLGMTLREQEEMNFPISLFSGYQGAGAGLHSLGLGELRTWGARSPWEMDQHLFLGS